MPSIFDWIDIDCVVTACMFGILVIAAQLVMNRSAEQIFCSAVKAMTGFFIFNFGVFVFLNEANQLRLLATAAFGVVAPANTNDFFRSQGIYYVPVMAFGFLLHLLIERKIVPDGRKIVHMGGCHVLLRLALLTTGIAVTVYKETNWLYVVAFGTVITGVWYCVQPMYIDKQIERIRGDSAAAYGHQTSISIAITALAVKLLVRNRRDGDDTESIRLPKFAAILRDMGICMFLLQSVAVLVFCGACGGGAVREICGTQLPIPVWAVAQGLQFSAGYFILTSGLRMITSELMPALGAISKKLVPNAKAAMDVPTLFPFGQNAVLFGAVSGSAVFFFLLLLFARLGWGFIGGATLYFYMAAGGAAVFGNKAGGRKGAVIGGVITALLMAGGSLLIQYLGGAFYTAEYFCNVASEPDDRLLLYPIVILLGRLLFGPREIPFG